MSETAVQDPAAQPAAGAPAGAAAAGGPPPEFTWKDNLGADLANAPSMQKYANTKDGFIQAVKSHLELEKMLGHEKIPVPKGPEDKAAMDIFKRAFRIPDKAEGYGLPDVELPESMKGISIDKAKFGEIALKYNLTSEQARNMWTEYQEMIKGVYSKAEKEHQAKMTGVVNAMRLEWGDAYDSNVQLGQLVINKFSDDQATNDFITATLVSDPRGIKFLSKIGAQFAENKVGDFKYSRHSMTPEEAQKEIDLIRNDHNHPYNNDRATDGERQRAIDYVNALYAVIQKRKG